jgi:hypothetical protein
MSKDKDVKKDDIRTEPDAPAVETKPKAAPVVTEQRVYVGPTIIKYGIYENTVFNGSDLPANVQLLADKHAEIRALIVPLSALPKTQQRLTDAVSLEFKYFAAIKKIN